MRKPVTISTSNSTAAKFSERVTISSETSRILPRLRDTMIRAADASPLDRNLAVSALALLSHLSMALRVDAVPIFTRFDPHYDPPSSKQATFCIRLVI